MPASHYLLLLGEMCGAHPMYAEGVVNEGLLHLLREALDGDPNRFYWEVRRAADCLWLVLQANSGVHAAAVRRVPSIADSMQPFILNFSTDYNDFPLIN